MYRVDSVDLAGGMKNIGPRLRLYGTSLLFIYLFKSLFTVGIQK